MKKLKDPSRAERVDSWSTAFLILMLVHTSVAMLSLHLKGSISLLCGLLAAAGYLFGRPRFRQYRRQGRGAMAWTALRIFETACVALVVFLLATMYAGVVGNPVFFYVVGGILSGSFVTYRAFTWYRQYDDGPDESPSENG